jgi:tetratricopeptide (TPR) repeat protein
LAALQAEEAAEAIEPVEPAEEMPDWLAALQAEEAAEPEVTEAVAEVEGGDTDLWRDIMREEGLEEMIEAVPAEVEGVSEEIEAAERMPDWLAALQPGAIEEEGPFEETTVAEALVKVEMTESEPTLEKAEETEPVPEEEPVPDWLAGWQGEVETEDATVEAAISEGPEVEVAAVEVAEQEAAPKEVAKEIKEKPVSFIVSTYLDRLETHPNDHEVRLALARAYRDEKRLVAAFEQFDKLVRSGHEIRDLVPDLEGLCASYPDDTAWHQLLGDAYVRINRLAEALEAYRMAQKALSDR